MKQIKIDVLDVGFHLWTDDEKQHGYTNLTDLLDGLYVLLSGVRPGQVVITGDGWIPWTPTGSALPVGLSGDDLVNYSCEDEPERVYSNRARELTWTRVGGATITRYRVVRS